MLGAEERAPGTESPYGVNSASLWSSLRPESTEVMYETPSFTALHLSESDAVRVVVRRPVERLPESLESVFAHATRCYIEDPFDTLTLRYSPSFTREPLPVMFREPGEHLGTPSGPAEVRAASSEADLITAERIVVDGYPLPSRQPFTPGSVLPAEILSNKDFQVWISSVDGEPACTCITHDDGVHSGIYWTATLPELRFKGAATSLFDVVVGGFSDRVQVLVTTDAGRPLYEKFGFEDLQKGSLLAKRP